MNLFQHFKDTLDAIVADLVTAGELPEGLDTARVSVEPPRDASHGIEMASNGIDIAPARITYSSGIC